MVRGLFSKWKQVIFVAFDQPMNKSILFQIIEELHNINYNVVGITSDNGQENVLLRKTLGITMENTFFNHPVTQAKIYAFGDSPHNLKHIRNWFVGEGIVWKGRVINTKLIRMLIDQRSNCELTPLFALTNKHLDLSSAEKQNMAKAAKLLSHTLQLQLYVNTSKIHNMRKNQMMWRDLFKLPTIGSTFSTLFLNMLINV